MMSKKIFWIFGILQHITLGVILFLIFHSFNVIHGESVIGLDTQIFLCIAFPLFSLLVKYTMFTKT